MHKPTFVALTFITSTLFVDRIIAQDCPFEDAGFTSNSPVHALLDDGNTVDPQTIFIRDREVRVTLSISSADAQRLLDAMGLNLEVDPDGNGTVPVQHYVARDRREYNTGECTGLKTRESMIATVSLLLGRDSVGNFNIPFVSFLTDAPAPISPYHDANADIRMTVENDTKGESRNLKVKTKTKSADGELSLSINLEYAGDLPFANNSSDLKALRFPLYARRTSGEVDRLWCSPLRERARLFPDDPGLKTLEVEARAGGQLCVNQLQDEAGDPVCAQLLTDHRNKVVVSEARIYRYAGLKCESEAVE